MDADIAAIVETFRAESEENLRALEDGLLALESRPDDDDAIATVFRHAHTLKGNALSLGFVAVSELAHAVEDVLDKLRKHTAVATAARTTLLLEGVDALRELLAEAAKGVDELGPRHRALMERLARADEAPPAPAGALLAPQAAAANGEHRQTVRVDIAKLDRLLNLVGELAIERRRAREELLEGAGRSAMLARYEEAEAIHADLHDAVIRLRMVPVGALFRRLARAVRDLATTHGKHVRVVTEGEHEEIDAALIEHVRDPLTHMIRNAIDHGIEPEADRKRAGKDPCGTITLRARHDAGAIEIAVIDDGRGLRREAIVKRAKALGVANADELPEDELHALVYRPGFSTAGEVSDLSGRGVGMDVVKRNVEAVRGAVRLESREGAGTTVTLRLPLTVAMVDGFAVAAAGETYVLPMDVVRECLDLPAGAPPTTDGIVDLRGHALPFVRLRDVLRVGAPTGAEREVLVVVQHGARTAGVVVDRALGVGPVVLKTAGKLLAGRRGLAGSTVLPSGRVAFVLDVGGLLSAVEGRRVERANEGAMA